MSKNYNSYTRDFPMTLDRDMPLPSEKTAEADFTAPLPEMAKEYYIEDSKPLTESEAKLERALNKPMPDGFCCCSSTKIVTPDALNLRAEPNGKILFCLKKGDVVTVGEVTDDEEWTHVHTDLGDGWVMSKYLG